MGYHIYIYIYIYEFDICEESERMAHTHIDFLRGVISFAPQAQPKYDQIHATSYCTKTLVRYSKGSPRRFMRELAALAWLESLAILCLVIKGRYLPGH